MTTILASGILYIRDESGSIQYSSNQSNWITISSFPATVVNTDTSTRLKVLFTTSLILTNLNEYFICGSTNIQFGSELLQADGSRSIITVNVNNYPGFIQNGTNTLSSNPFSDIYIYNLFVEGTGYQAANSAGWIGQELFGSETVCYIVNCGSSGDIGDFGGGIVGQGSGGLIGGSLTIRGCSSTGNIGQYAGGIAGHSSGGSYGSITCDSCWSEGAIGIEAGGILGSYAGNNGSATVTKSYSLGIIGQGGGGIFGYYAAETGQAIAEKCYSLGVIQINAGGIFGSYATNSGFPGTDGTANAINCYSSGTLTTSGNGIYGSNRGSGVVTTNCYSANGSWSSTSANASLTGVPSSRVGTTWVATTVNQPYELNAIGYTPYTVNIIDPSTSELIRTFSESVKAGETSSTAALTADASGNAFTILQSTGDGTITMSIQTGRLTTTSSTTPGTYTITLRSIGSYNITTFSLTVTAATSTDPNRATSIRYPDSDIYTEIKQGNVLLAERTANPQMRFYSYEQYARYKASQVTWS